MSHPVTPAAASATDARQLVAVISTGVGGPSAALHRGLGFVVAGRLPEAGRKFDQWIDIVFMRRRGGYGA